MGSEEIASCSRTAKSDENIGDSEQPLKKARYVWQLKGKYHLKDKWENVKNSECCTKTTNTTDEKENIIDKSDVISKNCRGRCYIEGLLVQSEKLMGYDDSSEEECSSKNIDKSIFDEIPVTLVKPNRNSHDYYLQKWQARQVAKGYMDNTINKVLESCMISPFDASEIIECCENDDQIEDEGILMAIQSHGLYSNDNWNNLNINGINKQFIKNVEIEEFTLDNCQNVHNEIIKNQMLAEGYDNFVKSDTFRNIELKDHSNFLEAAVSVAIQKKGLSSQNCT